MGDEGARVMALPLAPGSSWARLDAKSAADAALAALAAVGHRTDDLRPAAAFVWRGRATVPVQQLHGGVPVRGAGAIVAFDRRGLPTTVVHHRRHLTVGTTPAIGAAEAAARMAAALPAPARRPLRPSLVVLPEGAGVLAWEARATTASPPDAWRVTLPADGAGPARLARLSHTALGRVYPLHPHAGEPQEVTLGSLAPDAAQLESPAVAVWTLAWDGSSSAMTRVAAPDEAGDYLYDPAVAATPDPFAEVSAYHHLERAVAFFTERFGAPPPGPVQALVNYEEAPGEGYSNAYAFLDDDGQFQTVYGQTDELDYSYSALIAAHELGHPYFDQANDTGEHTDYPVNIDALGLHSAPAGMNEGMSDYWAGAITGDVDVLAYVAEDDSLERTLRRLDTKTRCPDDLIGEAHMDGPLLSTTLWELRGALGEAVDEVAWALIHQLSGAPTFADAAALVRTNVAALVEDGVLPEGSVEATDAILAERGIDTCARSAPLVAGTPRVGTAIGADTVARSLGMDDSLCSGLRLIGARVPLVVSYVATVPEADPAAPGEAIGGLSLTFTMERLDGEPLPEADALYDVAIRKGAPVELALVPIPLGGITLSIPNGVAAADRVFDGTPATVTLMFDELDVAPGDALHINILSAHCHSMRHTTTLAWLPPAPPLPVDAGTPDATEPDAAEPDAGAPDTGAPDSEPAPDASVETDAGVPPDAGADAMAAPDVAVPDAGAEDTAAPTPGATSDGCAAAPGPGAPALLLLLLLGVRRRQPRGMTHNLARSLPRRIRAGSPSGNPADVLAVPPGVARGRGGRRRPARFVPGSGSCL